MYLFYRHSGSALDVKEDFHELRKCRVNDDSEHVKLFMETTKSERRTCIEKSNSDLTIRQIV